MFLDKRGNKKMTQNVIKCALKQAINVTNPLTSGGVFGLLNSAGGLYPVSLFQSGRGLFFLASLVGGGGGSGFFSGTMLCHSGLGLAALVAFFGLEEGSLLLLSDDATLGFRT